MPVKTKKRKLDDKLEGVKKGGKSRKESLWKGPLGDGVTQSLLSSYIVCKERFRLKVIEGLGVADTFSHRMEYGNMWHICEEALAAQSSPVVTEGKGWQTALKVYCQALCKKYPPQQSEIEKWYQVCKVQFPLYAKYWSKHRDVKNCTPLLAEKSFRVPYLLPSGRTVTLRGKWDSIDLVGKGRNAKVWLQENKTKGEIKEELIARQLLFDLQTMFYLVALQERLDTETASNSLLGKDYGRVVGVRYNVIRRPLSGGKGSIKQLKPTKGNPQGETSEHYYARLGEIIEEAVEPDGTHYFFMRWNVEVTKENLDEFKKQLLNPLLENLCDDYEWWDHCKQTGDDSFNYLHREMFNVDHSNRHYRFPFGVYNPLIERGASELDEFLATGSELGLERTDNLFPELGQ